MKRRVFVTIAAMLLALAAAVGYFSAAQIKNDYIDSVEEQLTALVYTLTNTNVSEDNLNSLAESLSKGFAARVSIISPEGDFLYDSEGADDENILEREEIKAAQTEQIGVSQRDNGNGKSLYIAARFADGRYARVAVPLGGILNKSEQLYSRILIIIVLCTSALLIITWRFSSIIMLPINEMTEVARDYAAGHYTRFMSKEYSGELGILAETLNTMSNRLIESNENLARENATLEAIMEAMSSGVIAVDAERKPINSNLAANKMLGIDLEEEGRPIADISEHLDKYVEKALDVPATESEDIVINIGKASEKIVRVRSSRMKVEGKAPGAVIILDDISDYKRLENIRSEFAANASHELKTPLTSIHGFVETLQQGVDDPEQMQRFLKIILNETDRLTRIINDILYLSALESHHEEPRDRVDIVKCINKTLEIMLPQAEKKGLDVEFIDKAGGSAYTVGSQDRVMQMLVNLLSNAIKYTPEGKVALTVSTDQNNITISVADTGIGIPVSAQARLFERFYRVDKGRSRELGGTGLGLAIVKHAVLSMHGDITVDSQPGEGSTFTVILPRD